jgi:hypothetical protein
MKAECLEARGRLTPKQIVVAAMRKLLVLQKSLEPIAKLGWRGELLGSEG